MEIRKWLQQWLGIIDLHEQITELDKRVDAIETHVALTLRHFGSYRNRTNEELALMRLQLETMLAAVSNVIETIKNQTDNQRALRLKRRLQNILTRINKASSSRIA